MLPRTDRPGVAWYPVRPGRDGKGVVSETEFVAPFRWEGEHAIEVCASGDLFEFDLSEYWVDRAWAVMAALPQHRFVVATKHVDRLEDYLRGRSSAVLRRAWAAHAAELTTGEVRIQESFPLSNVWVCGRVSEDCLLSGRELHADWVAHLLRTPAAVRAIKAVPLEGPLVLDRTGTGFESSGESFGPQPEWRHEPGSYNPLGGTWWAAVGDPEFECATAEEELPRIHWVVAGAAALPDADPVHPDWVRGIRDQCEANGVPFSFRGWGEWSWQEAVSFDQAARLADGKECRHFICGRSAIRVGAANSGRLLDRRRHDAMPAIGANHFEDERPLGSRPDAGVDEWMPTDGAPSPV